LRCELDYGRRVVWEVGKLRQNADWDIATCELEGVTCCYGQGVYVPVGLGINLCLTLYNAKGERG
jgi:hypothetical protein